MVQTPQGFDYQMILKAHRKIKNQKNKITDDAQVAEMDGAEIFLSEGDAQNKKITTIQDLPTPGQQTKTCVGMGFDVHAFETGTHVTICGIKIPHTHQLKGYSDADVGLHALTDAILGAIGAGDIGEHFPPSDAKWRDADSSIFVHHALELMSGKSASISNVDITIICEEPKLTPYKPQIKEFLAKLLEIEADFVNIKATTTEGLGFTGRKEGIAAQAIILVTLA